MNGHFTGDRRFLLKDQLGEFIFLVSFCLFAVSLGNSYSPGPPPFKCAGMQSSVAIIEFLKVNDELVRKAVLSARLRSDLSKVLSRLLSA